MIEALHNQVMEELSRAQVRCAREAKRLGADQPTFQSVMFAVLVDMLVANTIAAARDNPSAGVAQLEKSVVTRYRQVLKQARDSMRPKLQMPGDIIVPNTLPTEIP